MKADVIKLDGSKAGQVDLKKDIFGLEKRPDILHRVVNWQLARRRSGSASVKFRSDIRATGAKLYRQKGTGRARHGSARANIFVGGGRAFGPIPGDKSHKLPKKIRALGLKTALSAKFADKKLIVLDNVDVAKQKTADLAKKLDKLGVKSALFIDGEEVSEKFKRAISNIPQMDVLPSQGINVYDILRRDTLVLTKNAVKNLEERFK